MAAVTFLLHPRRRLIVNERPLGCGNTPSGPYSSSGKSEEYWQRNQSVANKSSSFISQPSDFYSSNKHAKHYPHQAQVCIQTWDSTSWVISHQQQLCYSLPSCHGPTWSLYMRREEKEINFSNVVRHIISGKASQISLAINLGSALQRKSSDSFRVTQICLSRHLPSFIN